MVFVCENYLDLMELNKFVFIIVVYFLWSKKNWYFPICDFFSLFTKIIIYLSFHLPFLSITIFISILIFIYIIIFILFHYSPPSTLKYYNFQYFLFCRLASLVKQQQKYFLQETFKKWKLYSSFSRKADILQKEKGICN